MDRIDYLIQELISENPKYIDMVVPSTLEEKKNLYRALRNVRDPKPISDEYLKVQDLYLKEELQKKGIVSSYDIPFDLDIISIWEGDITTLKVDVIVNACNEYLLGCFNPTHRCIDNEIHSFAGMQLREECNRIMKGETLPNGEVVLTSAYNLPSHYIIQTVGPQVMGEVTPQDMEDLKNCYLHSLELAYQNNLSTIAFPCIATGLYGFPQEEASMIAIRTVKDFLKEHEGFFTHIIFNVFKDEDFKIYHKNIDKV